MGFYRYTEGDFEEMPASALREGDQICMPDWHTNRYGAITIEQVVVGGDLCAIRYQLPDEAQLTSQKDAEIKASWEDGNRVITVMQTLDANKIVMARRVEE